jgi:hypothetical protein
MKRLLLLGAVLAWGLGTVPASADYVVIKIDLNKMEELLGQQGGTPMPGMPGVPGLPGVGGAPGGQPPGFPGGKGSFPSGFPGGQPPGFPFPGGQAAEGGKAETPPLWATAYIETREPAKQTGFVAILQHQWGKSHIPLNLKGVKLKLWSGKSLAQRFDKKRQELGKGNPGAGELLHLAEWALEHRLLKQFETTMEEVVKADPKNQVGQRYKQVQAQLAKPPSDDEPAARSVIAAYKDKNYKGYTSPQGHYTLLTKLDDEAGIRRRLDRLERTYRLFFYWFALKGEGYVPAIPAYRLVVIVPGTSDAAERSGDAFAAEQRQFGAVSTEPEGFTARRDNVVVLAPRRLDPAFTKLEATNQQLWLSKQVSKQDLLSDAIFKAVQRRRTKVQPAEVFTLQMLYLVQKAMADEAERATISQEGTRQLLAATGLLPRDVACGEWIRYGLASFFETSRDALYPTAGLADWDNLITFKLLVKSGKLSAARAPETLLSVITDEAFRRAYADLSGKGAGASSTRGAQELEVARAVSWALTYYLMKTRLKNVLNYLKELRDLPRDVVYDAAVLEGCFGRAFGTLQAGAAGSAALDSERMKQLARDWFARISDQTHLDTAGPLPSFEGWALDERASETESSKRK